MKFQILIMLTFAVVNFSLAERGSREGEHDRGHVGDRRHGNDRMDQLRNADENHEETQLVENPNDSHHVDLSHINDVWQKFKGKFKNKLRKFTDGARELSHKLRFNENLDKVAQHNQRFAQKLVRFKTRIHQFSDWTADEIRKHLFGSTKVPREDEIVRLESAPERSHETHHLGLEDLRNRIRRDPIANLDYRDYGFLTPIKKQAAALEGQFYAYHGKLVELSPQHLIDCAKDSYGNFGCDGGWPTNAWNYVKDAGGITNLTRYPFTGHDTGTCRYRDSERVERLRVTGSHYLPNGDEESLRQAVLNVGPIAVAINADSWGFLNYAEGIFEDDACTDAVNHAVLVIGYGTTSEGTDYWLVKNSWGADWGDKGYIRMARNRNNQCGIASWGQYPDLG